MGQRHLIPRRVKPGDTVAIVSPSAPAVAWWPHRVERGRSYLESLGLHVKLMQNAGGREGWVSGSPEARAQDIHDAFLDDEVAVVLASIGGNHSNQLLPYLDYELLRSHPKIFQGYSDTTVLHWALLKHAGLRTFYGPALTTELAEYPEVFPHTDKFLRAAWFGSEPIHFQPAADWTDELLDFFQQVDLTRPRKLRPSEGWVSIREGMAEGPLVGGCLETICWHLKGSENWLDLEGVVFFLETSEEAPSPAHIDAYLTDLEQLGVFAQVAGLIFARPYGYDADRTRVLWEVVRKRTEKAGIPILGNVECGHTSPMLTLPLGASVRLDANDMKLAVLEQVTL
jgi:muramoyltetrapeptide carboxypeptidase LdcA involved in peptidoglycan recycling